MSKDNPTDVSAAFELILEEIEIEIGSLDRPRLKLPRNMTAKALGCNTECCVMVYSKQEGMEAKHAQQVHLS